MCVDNNSKGSKLLVLVTTAPTAAIVVLLMIVAITCILFCKGCRSRRRNGNSKSSHTGCYSSGNVYNYMHVAIGRGTGEREGERSGERSPLLSGDSSIPVYAPVPGNVT